MKNEMYIIDQHAAHERIMYENIKKNFYSDLKEYMIESDVIVVSHNQTLKMLYSIIYQVRLEDIWNSINFQNGELVKFCFN